MYIDRALAYGYNPYLTSPEDDANTGMDVGVLRLAKGQEHSFAIKDKELALLLLEGSLSFCWDGKDEKADRPDTFNWDPWCLHVPKDTPVTVKSQTESVVYVQSVENEGSFEPKLYSPKDLSVQHAGSKGELMGCMEREIKTLFDYESAPWSNMVLGEVLNYPGKWSSYPPHHHPQPEVYFYRFDRPQGFGAGFGNGEVWPVRHNGLLVIHHGFHSQVAAPGYAMCYVWGIHHLPGNPWKKTRIDEEPHKWLLDEKANDLIFTGGKTK